jgi:hypothetical protein
MSLMSASRKVTPTKAAELQNWISCHADMLCMRIYIKNACITWDFV